jgi:hypothetical protein
MERAISLLLFVDDLTARANNKITITLCQLNTTDMAASI